MKKTQVQRIMVVEMRMIHWMCGYIILDKIRNIMIRDEGAVAFTKDKMRETRFK